MNWGHKIMIVFSLFVAGIILLVIKSSRQEQQLVTTGYYEKELVYQQTIDARNNSSSLAGPVDVSFSAETIFINFPDYMKGKVINASIQLYCPADEKQDRKAVKQTATGFVKLPVHGIKSGKYYVKLSWNAAGKSYYDEHQLMVP